MVSGGRRKNAGRPAGTGNYGEQTKPVRIPVSKIEKVMQLIKEEDDARIPLYSSKVQAGFPSPAEDFVEGKIDLNSYLIKHQTATFMVRVTGESMINAGIFPNDLLIVDKSLEATHGKIVIAALDGELTVKRLSKLNQKVLLMPENPKFDPIDITDKDVLIWGVVTFVIHSV